MISMNTKLLMPWRIRHDGPSLSDYVRYICGQENQMVESVIIYHFKISDGFWVRMKEHYKTFEKVKEAADKLLIEEGYTLLNEEQFKKLEILL